MTPLAALILLGSSLVIFVAAGIAALLLGRGERQPLRAEDLRAGEPAPVDARTAALRAGGSTAWMRPSGGGF